MSIDIKTLSKFISYRNSNTGKVEQMELVFYSKADNSAVYSLPSGNMVTFEGARFMGNYAKICDLVKPSQPVSIPELHDRIKMAKIPYISRSDIQIRHAVSHSLSEKLLSLIANGQVKKETKFKFDLPYFR